LEKGADIDIKRGIDGKTPIMRAASPRRHDYYKVFSLLMKKGASLSEIDKNGDTVLHIAIRDGRNLSIINDIIEKCGEKLIHVKNNNGETPLKLAIIHGISGETLDNILDILFVSDVTDEDLKNLVDVMDLYLKRDDIKPEICKKLLDFGVPYPNDSIALTKLHCALTMLAIPNNKKSIF
jgi:ankyrin repeat protein